MATFNAGSIQADMKLDRSAWNTELKELQAQFQELEAKTITIGFDSDTDNFEVGASNVELIADSLQENDVVIKVVMDSDEFHKAAAQVEGVIDFLSGASPTVTVDMDSSDFHTGAAQVEVVTDVLKDPIDINVGMDSTAFHAAAAQVELVTDAMSTNDINIGVETSGIPKTLAELAELETAIEIVDANDVKVNVDYDANTFEKLVGSGASGASGGGGGSMGLLQLAIIAVIALSPILSVAIGVLSADIVAFTAFVVAALVPLALLIGAIVLLIKKFKATDPKDWTPGMEFLNQQWLDLKKTIDDFTSSPAAENFFMAMGTALSIANDVLKAFLPLMSDLGGYISDVADNVAAFTESPEFATWIDFFSGFGFDALKMFVSMVGSLIRFLMNLFIAISPFARSLMGGLTDDLKNLATWSDNLSQNKGFQEWIENARHFAPLLLDMLGSIFLAFMNISDAIRPFAEPMIKLITDIADAIANIPTDVLTQLIILGLGLFGVFKVLIPLISTGVEAFGAMSTGLELLAGALGVSVGPLLLIIGLVAAFVAMVIYMWNTNETFRNSIIESWQQIKETVAPIIKDIVQLVKDNWPQIKETAQEIWTNVQAIFEDAAVIIHQLIFFLTTGISFIWKHFGDNIIKVTQGYLTFTIGFFRGFFQILRGLFDLIRDVLTGKWSKVGHDLWEIAKGFWTIIVALFRGSGQILQGMMGALGHVLGAAWRALWALVKSLATSAFGSLRDQFMGFVHWLGGIPGQFRNAMSGAWDFLTGGFRNAINTIIGWWNGLSFTIGGFDPPGPGPKIPGFTVSTPNLPMVAQGGWFDEPTIAMIGEGSEPEIVAPESKMLALLDKAVGQKPDHEGLAAAIVSALRPLLGAPLTVEMVERILEKAGARVNIDASNDDRSARALASEMAWELRLLGYGGGAAV